MVYSSRYGLTQLSLTPGPHNRGNPGSCGPMLPLASFEDTAHFSVIQRQLALWEGDWLSFMFEIMNGCSICWGEIICLILIETHFSILYIGAHSRYRIKDLGFFSQETQHILIILPALTVNCPFFPEPLEVLTAMRNYVHHFFGCRHCAEHFENMAEESMMEVETLKSAVLWLWSRHNRVNNRLGGKRYIIVYAT